MINNVNRNSEVTTELTTIFDFASMAYDPGFVDRVVIAIPGVTQDSQEDGPHAAQ